jgi:Fic family protein
MSAIEHDFLRRLNEFEQQQIRTSINYERMNAILISHHSTAIEGSSLTLKETYLLLKDGLTAKGKPLCDHNMVCDHLAALEEVMAMAQRKEIITAKMIQKISAMVMKNTGGIISCAAGNFDSSKGDWRKLSVYVGERYFTSCQKIEHAVEELCRELNMRNAAAAAPIEVYNLAFDAHFDLVSIHPFADGNGRTSRLLMNYILAYHKLPLSVLYVQDKQEYYEALEQCRAVEPADTLPLRVFMYRQQIKFFEEEIKKFAQGQKIITSLKSDDTANKKINKNDINPKKYPRKRGFRM